MRHKSKVKTLNINLAGDKVSFRLEKQNRIGTGKIQCFFYYFRTKIAQTFITYFSSCLISDHPILTISSWLAVGLFSSRSQKTSKCGKYISDTLA